MSVSLHYHIIAMYLIDLFLHVDKYLVTIVEQYAALTYGILFLVVFCETGLVVTPFLPGDSLLFAVGALSVSGALHIGWMFLILLAAAVLGDTVNYHIGKFLGPKILRKENSIFLHKEHIVRAQAFYQKHGGKTIVLARFLPIVRTFAPFVAGVGSMPYGPFLLYNMLGAVLWCGLFLSAGYFFGTIPVVQEHFSLVVLVIIALSVIPMIKELWFHYQEKKKSS